MYNFDNSMMTGCDVSYVCQYVHNLRAKGEIPWADSGTAIHSVLEAHFGGANKEYCMEILEREYDKIFPPGVIPEIDKMYAKNVFDITEAYLEDHPLDSFPFEVIELEKTVGIQLSPEYTYWIKRDMWVRDKMTGQYASVDHKTRWGKVNEWWWKKFNNTSQLTGYIWGNQIYCVHKGVPYSNNIYLNILSYDNLPSFDRVCKTHKPLKYHECRKLHTDFRLLTFSRTQAQIDNWKIAMFQRAINRRSLGEIYNSLEKLPYLACNGVFYEDAPGKCSFCKWREVGFDLGIMDNFVEVREPWEPWNDNNVELVKIY